MIRTGRFLLFFTACLALATETGWAQRASTWRSYRIADGLPDAGCASVTLSPRGRVLVQHVNVAAISELDGYDTDSIPAPVSARTRVHETPSGQLWCIVQEGLMEYKNRRWVLHPVREILEHFRRDASQDVPFFAVRQGRVIFLLPDRLMEFNAENPDNPRVELLLSVSQTGLERFHSLTPTRTGGLWISGGRGLIKVASIRTQRAENNWSEFILPADLEVRTLHEPFEDDAGGVTCVAEMVATNAQKAILSFDGRRWTVQGVGDRRLRRAWRGPNQNYWAITIDALFEMDAEGNLIENQELPVRQFLDVAVEPGGTFWLATSDGLFHYVLSPWRTPPVFREFTMPVHCLAEDGAGRLWFVAGADLCVLDGERTRRYPIPDVGGRNVELSPIIVPLRSGTILLGTQGSLFAFEPATGLFAAIAPPQSGDRLQLLGKLRNGEACVTSSGGTRNRRRQSFWICDGSSLRGLETAPPIAVTNRVHAMHAAHNGDLWFGSDLGVAWHHEDRWQVFSYSDPAGPTNLVCFVELSDGRIWGASETGIWETDGKAWKQVRIGFDGINAMARARDNSVWVAAETGLLRFVQDAWIDYGTGEGLPASSVQHVFEDQRGRLWAGTTHGLAVFPTATLDPTVDQHPPLTRIQRAGGENDVVAEGGSLIVSLVGRDKWKQTPRERLLYSYRLDDQDWSAFSEQSTIALAELLPGKHYLAARAMDLNANVEVNPSPLTFSVAVPWYKEARLVLIILLGVAGVLFFAGVAFNRHRQLLRSYAEIEKKVAERTRQLARANAELAHSQKMTALGTLAAGIAHDFNNILSIIKGSAQIIEDNLHDAQKVQTRADRIKTVVEQGSGIVRAMLGFSRGPDQQPAWCDVNTVAEETIKLLGDRFVREVEISFRPQSDLPAVPAPRDFLQQILLNFIFNAAESMTEKKHIIVSTRREKNLPSGLALTPPVADGYVFISVQDFGCGIAPENMPRIFEPFFTTKAMSSRRGTGLGLSMVYELARKMEAGLAAESVVHQGSTFTLILPVRELDTATTSGPAPVDASPPLL